MPSPAPAAERHVPVLCERIVELLRPALATVDATAAAPVYVDATLGLGGHAEAMLTAYPHLRVIGIDRDPAALAAARDRLSGFGDRVTYVSAVYDELTERLRDLGVREVAAILFDLGVSSMQLDDLDRGFAYRADAPLDMRMGGPGTLTAAEILNTYAVAELERILREYGEERFARRIARAVVARRDREPFATSSALVDLLKDAIPAASQRSGGHPAKRTFQALRIEVNDELGAWRRAVTAGIDALAVGGRIAVLSYHSLEDRITKQALTAGATSRTPIGLPVELPETAAYLRLITRGAERPSESEVIANPRAASARLRVAERVRAANGASASFPRMMDPAHTKGASR